MISFLGCCKTQAEQTSRLKYSSAFSYAVFKLLYKKGGGTGLDHDSASCHIKSLHPSHYLKDISICSAANLTTWHLSAGAKEHYTH